jgi:hypothetical protein
MPGRTQQPAEAVNSPRRHLATFASLLALIGCCATASGSAAAVIVSPLPDSSAALPGTQVSFLATSAGSLGSISVVGSRSGHHHGVLRAYAAASGASFLPSSPFRAGETVTVHAMWHQAHARPQAIGTRFRVAVPATLSYESFAPTRGTRADVQSFHSAPGLHPPAVTVHQAAGVASAPGYLFATPYQGPGQWGPMIFDSAGNLVWFHPEAHGFDAADLRTQMLHGRADLTWWQGRTVSLGFGLGYDVIADANYRTVAIVRAGNGLLADEHEFSLTPQGIAYVDAYSPVKTSLASAGGSASGIALDGVIQEIDIRTGLVMWEWHSLGHVALNESYSAAPRRANSVYDYFHLNSMEANADGDLLVSARNTWNLIEIDHSTGAVAWRLGGKRSSFSLGPGVAFAYQHNASWLANGDISLFDDEGAPTVKPPSRGEVIDVDSRAGSATLVSQFVHPGEPLVTGSQGNLQALPGGGWLVGWGGLPNVTEFNPQGQAIYDAQLPSGEQSYRVYRLPWAAQPTSSPAISTVSASGSTVVYASWNGATAVASWRLLAGARATKLAAIASVARNGFDTAIAAPAARFYAVQALSSDGRVLGRSRVVSAARKRPRG